MSQMIFPLGEAVFSDDGVYRFRLTRDNLRGPRDYAPDVILTLTFILLNPSTATADVNDPTIRRCMWFAIHWGYHRVVIVNMYAFRSTDPKKMWWSLNNGIDIIGKDNDQHIIQAVRDAALSGGRVVGAWGGGRTTKKSDAEFHRARAKHVGELANAEILRCAQHQPEYGTPKLMCLAMNDDGSPVHPLYQPNDSYLVPWEGASS